VLRHERLMRVRQLAAYSVASVTVASDAECGKRRTSWGPSRYRYRKSATAAPSVTDVPVARPSSIFDFVPGTSPSWFSMIHDTQLTGLMFMYVGAGTGQTGPEGEVGMRGEEMLNFASSQ
jgi:hypothetical protein